MKYAETYAKKASKTNAVIILALIIPAMHFQ